MWHSSASALCSLSGAIPEKPPCGIYRERCARHYWPIVAPASRISRLKCSRPSKITGIGTRKERKEPGLGPVCGWLPYLECCRGWASSANLFARSERYLLGRLKSASWQKTCRRNGQVFANSGSIHPLSVSTAGVGVTTSCSTLDAGWVLNIQKQHLRHSGREGWQPTAWLW